MNRPNKIVTKAQVNTFEGGTKTPEKTILTDKLVTWVVYNVGSAKRRPSEQLV